MAVPASLAKSQPSAAMVSGASSTRTRTVSSP
jgi:hypothetical protein